MHFQQFDSISRNWCWKFIHFVDVWLLFPNFSLGVCFGTNVSLEIAWMDKSIIFRTLFTEHLEKLVPLRNPFFFTIMINIVCIFSGDFNLSWNSVLAQSRYFWYCNDFSIRNHTSRAFSLATSSHWKISACISPFVKNII